MADPFGGWSREYGHGGPRFAVSCGFPVEGNETRFASWSAVRSGHRQQRFTYRAILRGGVRVASVAVMRVPNHSEQRPRPPLGEIGCGRHERASGQPFRPAYGRRAPLRGVAVSRKPSTRRARKGREKTPHPGIAVDELERQRPEGIWHREVYGYSRGKSSEGYNPKGATGTKQGRNGSRWSVRRAAVKNRTCRLLGRGRPEMTCYHGLQVSKGKRPQERSQGVCNGC